MLITRTSRLTGLAHTMDLPVTAEQIAELESGTECVQSILPRLKPYEREFLITGITPEEWDFYIGEEPEE